MAFPQHNPLKKKKKKFRLSLADVYLIALLVCKVHIKTLISLSFSRFSVLAFNLIRNSMRLLIDDETERTRSFL